MADPIQLSAEKESGLRNHAVELELKLRKCKESKRRVTEQRDFALAAHSSLAQDKAAVETALKDVMEKLLAAEEMNETLTRKLNQFEKPIRENSEEDLLRENQCLQNELAKTGRLTSDLTTEVADAIQERQRLHTELEAAVTCNEYLKNDVERLSDNVSQLMHARDELTHKVEHNAEELQALFAKEKAMNLKLTTQLNEAAEELAACRRDLVTVSEENLVLADEIAELKHEIGKQKETAMLNDLELAKLREQWADAETRLSVTLAINKEFSLENERLRRDFHNAQRAAGEDQGLQQMTARLAHEVQEPEHQRA